MPYGNAKQDLISILQQQPEDSSYEELIKELAFVGMINRGLRDVEAGRVSSDEDIRREITSWQKPQ
jgi:predicted transcriptional regulator